MDPTSMMLVGAGVLSLVVGFIGCIIPAIPGPKLSALGNLLLQIGFTMDGPTSRLGWALCILSVVGGVVMTVADLLAPLVVSRLGVSSRKAGRYATAGVAIALILGCTGGGPVAVMTAGWGTIPAVVIAALTVFAGAFIGGAVGEWEDAPHGAPDRERRALRSGIAQLVALGVSMVGKVVYGVLAIVLAAMQAAVQYM